MANRESFAPTNTRHSLHASALPEPVSTRAMVGTVRVAGERLGTAKEEIDARGITDRPTAALVSQLEQGSTLRGRNIQIDRGIIDMRLGCGNPCRTAPVLALAQPQTIGRKFMPAPRAIFVAKENLATRRTPLCKPEAANL